MEGTQPEDKASESHRIECLDQQLKEKDVLIEQLLDQINQMKSSYHGLLSMVDENGSGGMPTTVNGDEGEQSQVAKIRLDDDANYFETYASFHIHYDMLSVSIP